MPTVQELYAEIWGKPDPDFEAAVTGSLHPRGADGLYDLFAWLSPAPDDLVLDVGGRDATHAVDLARRFGCRVLSLDPVPLHAELARARVAEAGLAERVAVETAGIEALPVGDGEAAHVWCHDVLNMVDLPRGLAECVRALRPGGGMLVYQTFGTALLEPNEARRLYAANAIRPENQDPARFEAIARDVGVAVAEQDVIASEWREHWAEAGDRRLLDDLLAVARMMRTEAALVERFGRARFEAELGGTLWGVYQMLGKLCPTAYLLRKQGS
ncbi:MAG: hypothetical protein AVDCRST_MAG49-3395 [uncultured Thermomicrobiales bacterium]|uniref:Methyltransferase domain-containing protein n=1 Tax=uncultured Thermomicrobiales bacterium TaxID=1645740 RepID=A0A6J4V981_9BACT|nr:MAG: hypothetical protein AVDCRST_MAG49-3395 [uncultured Thermomicrobiales bacterium]